MKNERKSYRITPEEHKLLVAAKARQSDLMKEQSEQDRKYGLEIAEMRLRQFNRQLTHKELQVSGKIPLCEASDLFFDKKKPAYCVENEIEEIKLNIKKIQDSIKNMKEEQAKEEK